MQRPEDRQASPTRSRRLSGPRVLVSRVLSVGAALLAVGTRPAAAYVAPLSLDLFLQVVVGIAAALVVLVIAYWPRILRLLGRGKPGPPSGAVDPEQEDRGDR